MLECVGLGEERNCVTCCPVILKVKNPTSSNGGQKWGTRRSIDAADESIDPSARKLRAPQDDKQDVFVNLLADFFGPGFEIFSHLGHELVGYCAVDQAVIIA